MDELIRLQENIEKLIGANYPDEAIDNMIADSSDLCELNDYIEEELSYAADAEE